MDRRKTQGSKFTISDAPKRPCGLPERRNAEYPSSLMGLALLYAKRHGMPREGRKAA
jgi:hypothetical protein